MSHNVTLQGIKVKDLDLLREAVRNLKIEGVALDKTAKQFRTYRGQSTHCDAKITMPGPHDIGLRKDKNGDFDFVFDPYQMSQVLRHAEVQEYTPEAHISKLLQEYGLVQAEYEAAARGMRSQRIAGKAGHVALEVFAA